MTKPPTVAIVGRPNVGKSTLFNRIIGERDAIVHDSPGVTRDRNFGKTDWGGRSFWLVDTGGWTDATDEISTGIRQQVQLALDAADVVVLAVDTQQGVHPADLEVAQLLRPLRDRVVVAANKADDLANDTSYHAFYELGLTDPVPVSAATGKGSGDLLDRVVQALPENVDDSPTETIQVAVVGRPNVGKSSLLNRLIGEERTIVSAVPGTTRDAIDTPMRYHDHDINFIDTAGLRKRTKVDDDVEFYSRLRTEKAVERADVCVVVVDAARGVQLQDLKIAEKAWEGGAGIVLAVNKWDLIDEKDSNTAAAGRDELIKRVPFFQWIPTVYISAKTGQRARKVLDEILAVAE